MPIYRRDRSQVNEHGQTLHYAEWMGGPTLAAVVSAVCADGKGRTVNVRGEADTFFSIPASTRIGGKYASGYLYVEDGRWFFRATGVRFAKEEQHDARGKL